MNRRKVIFCTILSVVWLIGLVVIWMYKPKHVKNVTLCIETNAECKNFIELEYSQDAQLLSNSFNGSRTEDNAIFEQDNGRLLIQYIIPSDARFVRISFDMPNEDILILSSELVYQDNTIEISKDTMLDVKAYESISAYNIDESGNIVGTIGDQKGYIVWDISQYSMQEIIADNDIQYARNIHLILTIIVTVLFVFALMFRDRFIKLPEMVWDNRRLIWSIAKTDFKSKYASSYLGTFWAFVQPIVTVAIYVFVFQVGFKSNNTSLGYPYLLYLVAGICPWFFFAEAWMSATNCLIEYSYLVKKVVFKIEVLPIIKVISSLFVHFFFIMVVLGLFMINGRIPGYTFIQLVYYLFALICFILSLAYLTAAITPFFPDSTQIINIVTQLGMWTVPIMYDEAIMPERIMKILRFNPMYYIVMGYRDCFMHGSWIWDKVGLTLWFWLIVVVIFLIANNIFNKLRVHFADVL